MSRLEQLQVLNGALLAEMPEYRAQGEQFPREEGEQRRPPMPLDPEFLAEQDALLSAETAEKGVVDGDALVPTQADPRLVLWQGDITRLWADAIVNAANSALLGCFHPCHGCIDNAIHSAAGLQLRDECFRLMEAQGYPEPNGRAKLTGGYNLPARHVLHTVGPIVRGRVTQRDREELASCYRACLELAAERGLHSVAFCCISTGEFHFPNQEAAEIAVRTVREFLEQQREKGAVQGRMERVSPEEDAGEKPHAAVQPLHNGILRRQAYPAGAAFSLLDQPAYQGDQLIPRQHMPAGHAVGVGTDEFFALGDAIDEDIAEAAHTQAQQGQKSQADRLQHGTYLLSEFLGLTLGIGPG